jgi:hypothetical protein
MHALFASAILSISLIAACGEKDPASTAQAATTPASSPAAPAPVLDAGQQDADTLFRVMGGVSGKTVADLFADDGAYTFKLLAAGARVIAIGTEPSSLANVEKKARELGYGPDKLIIRQVQEGDPGIAPGEVDRALCTRTYLSIQDRVAFFSRVKAGLAAKGQLIIVDYLQEQTPMGPPMELRVNVEQIMDELEPCGFTDIGGYTKKIPYRFIVQAMDFEPGPGQ